MKTDEFSQDHPLVFSSDPGLLYSKHIAVLFLGGICGGFLSYWICGFPFDFSHELARARSLGIVSLTILTGYPVSLNVVNYMIVLVIPVLCAVIFWLIWLRGKKNQLSKVFKDIEHPPFISAQKRSGLLVLLLITGGLFVTFNLNHFYGPIYTQYVKSWSFLGEEGEMVAWAHRVIGGDVYGKDFFCLYGPLQIYPLAWFLELFGMNALTARVYTYLLLIASLGIVLFFLYRTLRSKVVFTVAFFASILIINMWPIIRSSNTTPLRNILALLPLLLLYLHRQSPRTGTLLLTGLIIGQSLLFSQEFGLCGLIASGCLFLSEAIFEKTYGRSFREAGILIASVAISVLPWLLYLGFHNALGDFLDSLYGYPILVTLGYGSLPFPLFRQFLEDPISGGMYLPYWAIFFYVFATIHVFSRCLLGKTDPGTKLKLMLTLFGILAFRVALGRYAESNVLRAIPPALLLCALFADEALSLVKSKGLQHRQVGGLLLFNCIVIPFALLLLYSPQISFQSAAAAAELLNPSGKFTIKQNGMDIPEIERARVLVDRHTGKAARKIAVFLADHTRAGEYVYFFPNAPMYYFLFDRRNPTRYGLAYTAISTSQRLEAIHDLEKNRPAYIIYNLNTWRIDNIPESVQVPEIVAYIHKNYHVLDQTRDLLFMARNRNASGF